MANISPSPLTPIGFDAPNAGGVNVGGAPGLSQPNTTGLDILNRSGQAFQQALESQSNTYATQAKITSDIAQQQTVSARAVSESSAMVAASRARAFDSTARAVIDLGSNVTEMINRAAKQEADRRAAEQKALIEQNKALAILDLEQAQVDWIEKGQIDKEGTGGYRDAVSSILGKYQLPPDDIASLTQKYFAPAVDYAKKTEENRITAAEKVATQQRRITAAGLQGEISSALGGLAASVGLPAEVVEGHYDKVSTAISSFMEKSEIPMLDRLNAVADAYEVVNKVMDSRNADTSRISQQLTAYKKVAEFASGLQADVLAGTLSINDYNQMVETEALANNLTGFKTPDPLAPTKFLEDIQQTEENIRDLKQKREISQIELIAADNVVIGSLATEFALNPAALAAVESTPQDKLDKNAKTAVKLVKDFNEWRYKGIPSYNQKIANLNTDMYQIKSSFETWVANALSRQSGGGSVTPLQAKALERLRIGGVTPEAMRGGGLTPDQLERVQQAAADVLSAKVQEGEALKQEYAVNQQRFAQVGLFVDVKTLKKAHQQFSASREEYNNRLRKIQEADTPAPGQTPNFKGGHPGKPASWKPLAKQNYGGTTVTMPFPQGTKVPPLFGGQAFGAPRPGRTHAGLDFAVPTGTPILSLVAGEVTESGNAGGYGLGVEVKGDDGFIYYYAHLDKSQVQVGQRVAAGQQIALSGASGVGSGPHLHLEVGAGNKFNVVDPLGHLASRNFGAPTKGTRTAGETSLRPNSSTPLPKGAIPLGKSSYLKDGKIIQVKEGEIRYGVVSYSTAAPLRSSRASNTRAPQPGEGNFGYGVLAKDREFRLALNKTADRLGVPGQWLADIIAHETIGTFSPSIGNGMGYYGLIQFGEDARKDLGVSVDQLKSMTPAQQMKYVEKYVRLQMQYAGVKKITSVEQLAASIFLGHTALRDVWENGDKAQSFKNGDFRSTLTQYLEEMGRFAGRKYNHMGGRRERLRASAIHSAPRTGCTLCNQLSEQTAFVIHEAEPYA
jgi:murein DD-endopeptidase MepM/ murein hydrolase activator NlpD